MRRRRAKAWDLPGLLSAADPKAKLAERNLWLVRLIEWLGHAAPGSDPQADDGKPVLRLRHLLGVLDRNPSYRAPVVALLARFLAEIDVAALFADFGFTPRVDLFGELGERQRAAASVSEHLEEFGVSVDIVFQVNQLRQRVRRIEALLACVESEMPARDVLALLATLVDVAADRRSVSALRSRHYALLAAKVTERSAETGEHYITRDHGEYRRMLHAAAIGGVVLAATTHIKFIVVSLGLAAFWRGFLAGLNYAASFVIVQLVHGTVATRQPAPKGWRCCATRRSGGAWRALRLPARSISA